MKDGERELSELDELKEYLLPLTSEERKQLEENLLLEGCRDPLVVWPSQGTLYLIDGHNRYSICKKHGLTFSVKKLSFENIAEVKHWMVNNQLGRRNLNPDQMSYYRGLRYLMTRQSKGGDQNVKAKGQRNQTTSQRLAIEYNVSPSTIKRDAKYAEGLEIIGKANPGLKKDILQGKVLAGKSDISIFTSLDSEEREDLFVVSKVDLANKARAIKNRAMDEIESQLNKIDEAREVLKEPLFMSERDRMTSLKARIISAVNHAINDKNLDAVQQIKTLVDRLERELLAE